MKPGLLEKHHYPVLDGLRGVAILFVVFLHNFGVLNTFFFGWLGVDLFFVLSGFLITEILLSTVNKPHFLRNFYMRRLLRIFPLYYLILVICLMILPLIGSVHTPLDYYKENQLWLWTYTQNWLFILKEPHNAKILLHTWSLAVEEQFYLVWPLLILLIRKPRVLLWVVLALLLVVGTARYVIWICHFRDLAYASLYTFTRIDGICIGCLLALVLRVYPGFLKKYTTLIVLLIAAVNLLFYFMVARHGYTLPYLALVGYTTFAVLFGLLVYEGIKSQFRVIRILFDNAPLKFFGRISYGLYVFHWPVHVIFFNYFRSLFYDWVPRGNHAAEVLSGISVTIIAILISVASYKYFEMPFLKLKKKFV